MSCCQIDPFLFITVPSPPFIPSDCQIRAVMMTCLASLSGARCGTRLKMYVKARAVPALKVVDKPATRGLSFLVTLAASTTDLNFKPQSPWICLTGRGRVRLVRFWFLVQGAGYTIPVVKCFANWCALKLGELVDDLRKINRGRDAWKYVPHTGGRDFTIIEKFEKLF